MAVISTTNLNTYDFQHNNDSSITFTGVTINAYNSSTSIIPNVTDMILNNVNIGRFGINSLPSLVNLTVRGSNTLAKDAIFYAPKLKKLVIESSTITKDNYVINSGKHTLKHITIQNNTTSLGKIGNDSYEAYDTNNTNTRVKYNDLFSASGVVGLMSHSGGVIFINAGSISFDKKANYVDDSWWVTNKKYKYNGQDVLFGYDCSTYAPGNKDLKSYYYLDNGNKAYVVPNALYRMFTQHSLYEYVIKNHLEKITFNNNLSGGSSYNCTLNALCDENGKVQNMDTKFHIKYDTFTVTFKTDIDYNPDNMYMVPFISVLKKHKEYTYTNIKPESANYTETSLTFSYSESGVLLLLNILNECSKTITKFINNVYSINISIKLSENDVNETLSNGATKSKYLELGANRLLDGVNYIFRREKIAEYFSSNKHNDYTDYKVFSDWTYEVYKYPKWQYLDGHSVTVYDNNDKITDSGQCKFAKEELIKSRIDYLGSLCRGVKCHCYIQKDSLYYFETDLYKVLFYLWTSLVSITIVTKKNENDEEYNVLYSRAMKDTDITNFIVKLYNPDNDPDIELTINDIDIERCANQIINNPSAEKYFFNDSIYESRYEYSFELIPYIEDHSGNLPGANQFIREFKKTGNWRFSSTPPRMVAKVSDFAPGNIIDLDAQLDDIS